MSAVEVPVAAVVAAVRAAVAQRSPEGIPSFQAGVEAAAPVIASKLVEDLIEALRGHWRIYQGMNDRDAARGLARAIRHLEAYKVCVDKEIES